MPLAPILENLRLLDDAGARIWLRLPFVPGWTDDPTTLHAIGSFVASLRSHRLHLLPYHQLGDRKRARLGQPTEWPRCARRTPPPISAAADLLRGYGLDIHVGG